MHRVLFAVYRKQGMSTEDFFNHYTEVHIPIAKRFGLLRDYDIFPVAESVPAPPPGGPDAFAIMTFDTPGDFAAVVASPEFAEAVADNETFVDHFDTYTIDLIPVVGAA